MDPAAVLERGDEVLVGGGSGREVTQRAAPGPLGDAEVFAEQPGLGVGHRDVADVVLDRVAEVVRDRLVDRP